LQKELAIEHIHFEICENAKPVEAKIWDFILIRRYPLLEKEKMIITEQQKGGKK